MTELTTDFSALYHSVVSNKQIDTIRNHSAETEINARLSPEVLDLIYRKSWLKIMEPTSCAGLAWDLPHIVHFFEALAYADGNVGWCVNLGAGANLFSGYLSKKAAKNIFTSAETWCAGSGATTGEAYETDGGYRVNGYWKYASGSLHATHFTANCKLFNQQGEAIMQGENQVFKSFIFPADQVKIHSTWNVSGLKATNSNDFEVKNSFVPHEHVFNLLNPSDFADAPIFKFPFDTLAVVNMACMPLGIGIHFLELFEELILSKIPLHSQQVLAKQEIVLTTYETCKSTLLNRRTDFYKILNETWNAHTQKQQASIQQLQDLNQAARLAAQTAQDMLHQLFKMCGMTILYDDSELNKVWRDLVVAGQHYLLSPMATVK